MMKLISLALTSTIALSLAGCGDTTPVVLDKSSLTAGESNKTGLGGYWWTYVDRSGLSSVTPDTGKVVPDDPDATELKGGITGSDDPTLAGNKVLHVTGSVNPAPKWTATLGDDGVGSNFPAVNWTDPYVNKHYGPLCVAGLCGEVKYPAAGLGAGFKGGNALLGADAAGKLGIGFRLMLGANHNGIAAGTPSGVALSLPMDLTDVPDASYGDKFGSEFAEGTPHSGVPAVKGTNTPFCSFPNSISPTGTGGKVGGTNKTCFANVATQIQPLPVTANTWTTYCVTWDAFSAPGWAVGLGLVGITTVVPERIIKVQFDAYKPKDSETAATAFDFYVDDAVILDADNMAEYCNDPNLPAIAISAANDIPAP